MRGEGNNIELILFSALAARLCKHKMGRNKRYNGQTPQNPHKMSCTIHYYVLSALQVETSRPVEAKASMV